MLNLLKFIGGLLGAALGSSTTSSMMLKRTTARSQSLRGTIRQDLGTTKLARTNQHIDDEILHSNDRPAK